MKIKKPIVIEVFILMVIIITISVLTYLQCEVSPSARGRFMVHKVSVEIVFPLWSTIIPSKHAVDNLTDTPVNVVCDLIKNSNGFVLIQTIDHSAGTILFLTELNDQTQTPAIGKNSWNCYLFVPDKADLFRMILQHPKSSQILYYTTECPSVFFEIKKISFDPKELLYSHDFYSTINNIPNARTNLRVFGVMTKDGRIYFLH
jgi:hypothetical protein